MSGATQERSLPSKLTALLLVSCLSMRMADARYSKVNMQSAFADYESSFKTKDFNLSLEDDYQLDSDLAVESSHPLVGQGGEDSYDGYVKPKEAFSQTDGYQYALQFKIGAKLDNNYDYVDECFDAWIDLFDKIPYFQNNVTYSQQQWDNETLNHWFYTYLNLTGIIFGPVSDIIVDCYRFGESFYDYENTRFQLF